MLVFYECDSCAACCGTYAIFASREDAQREPRIADECQELAAWLETPKWAYRLFPLPFHKACCFLDDEHRCTSYPTRPQVCREFEAGSEDCQRVRTLEGTGSAGARAAPSGFELSRRQGGACSPSPLWEKVAGTAG